MLIHELSAPECVAILERSDLGRLGCAHNDQPYIVPIHFSFDPARRCLYAFSTIGQKIEWMRENPKVCVEVEDVADPANWTTVLAFGRYEEMGDSLQDAAARETARRLFEGRPEWWLPAAAKVASRDERASVLIYRIQIDRLTGRRAGRRL
jgi:uncharacterized protein